MIWKAKHPEGEAGIKQNCDWLSGPGSLAALASSDSDNWLLLTCINMAPKLELPNAAAIMWLILLFLIRPAEANDAGNTLALVVVTAVSMVGFCACLGWYARRRNRQLWDRLRGLCACSQMLPTNTLLTVRNQSDTTYELLWLRAKTCLNRINAESAAESSKGAEESIQEVRAQELLRCPKSLCFLAKKKNLHILVMLNNADNSVHSLFGR